MVNCCCPVNLLDSSSTRGDSPPPCPKTFRRLWPEGLQYTPDGIMRQPGPLVSTKGLPVLVRGHPLSARGPPISARGPPVSVMGPSAVRGTPISVVVSPISITGPPLSARGPPISARVPPCRHGGLLCRASVLPYPTECNSKLSLSLPNKGRYYTPTLSKRGGNATPRSRQG